MSRSRSSTGPGPGPKNSGPGPEVWVRGPQKVPGPDLDGTLDSLASSISGLLDGVDNPVMSLSHLRV